MAENKPRRSTGDGKDATCKGPGAGQRQIVRRRLLVWAACVITLAVGYCAGRVVRDVAIADRKGTNVPTTDAALGKIQESSTIPSGTSLDTPLPATADELITEVTQVVEQSVRVYPAEPDALEMKARLQRWLGDSRAADRTWDACLKLNPQYVHALVGKAAAAAERGEHNDAAQLSRKAIDLEASNFQARAVLADSLINLGKPDDAIEVLEPFLQADPRSQGFFLLGQAYFQLGKYDEAKASYESAIKIYPDYLNAYHGLALVCDRLELADQASAARAQFQELGSPEQAAKRIRGIEVSDLDMMYGNAAEILSGVARVYFVHGKDGEAEALWLRAAALDPSQVDCRQSLAFLCRRAERLGEAIGWLSELAHLEPGVASYRVEIGRLCEEVSGPAAAEKAFRRACEDAPDSADGYAALADLLLRYEHNLPETVELARQAVRLNPSAPHHAMLSASLRANGDSAGALAAIDQAIKLAPQSASYHAVRDAILADQ